MLQNWSITNARIAPQFGVKNTLHAKKSSAKSHRFRPQERCKQGVIPDTPAPINAGIYAPIDRRRICKSWLTAYVGFIRG
jgi:hypothetical protein